MGKLFVIERHSPIFKLAEQPKVEGSNEFAAKQLIKIVMQMKFPTYLYQSAVKDEYPANRLALSV